MKVQDMRPSTIIERLAELPREAIVCKLPGKLHRFPWQGVLRNLIFCFLFSFVVFIASLANSRQLEREIVNVTAIANELLCVGLIATLSRNEGVCFDRHRLGLSENGNNISKKMVS